MLNIIICEDNPLHKKQIEKCVENCIMIHNLDMKIVLTTESPDDVIRYVKKEERVTRLYFLDVDLKSHISGIELAGIVRESDPRGFIVFITTHSEALPLTFKHKVEAMDFIIKDEFYELQDKIYDCILNAQEKYIQQKNGLQRTFTMSVLDKLVTFEYSRILYFETSVNNNHKIRLCTKEGIFEFFGAMYKVEKVLDDSFFRCHHSYIINTRQEFVLDIKQRIVTFRAGGSCPVSSRRWKALAKILQNNEFSKP